MHTFERRKLEVFLAVLTAGFGVWLLFPSVAMRSPGLQPALAMMGEGSWGALFLSNGMMHCLYLIHLSEPTRRTPNWYSVFCLTKKN